MTERSQYEERRRFPRYELALPVEIDGLPGTTRNLGLSGVAFVSARHWSIGEEVVVTIHTGGAGARAMQLRAAGPVLRCRPVGKEQYETAIRIDDLTVVTEIGNATRAQVSP